MTIMVTIVLLLAAVGLGFFIKAGLGAMREDDKGEQVTANEIFNGPSEL